MNRISLRMTLGALSVLMVAGLALHGFSHCQIPCGIYDDSARFVELREHIDTMEKSIAMIHELAGESDTNYNQIVRWVASKDLHADELTKIVTYYFLTQRVKPVGEDDAAFEDYQKQITLLHHMMVNAMKVKQTTDASFIEALDKCVDDYEELYFGLYPDRK